MAPFVAPAPPRNPFNGCIDWPLALADSATCTDEKTAFGTWCEGLCGVPFDPHGPSSTWAINTMNGVGNYQCPCCTVQGSVVAAEAVPEEEESGGIDWGALPLWIWALLVALPALLFAVGHLLAPKAPSYEMPFSSNLRFGLAFNEGILTFSTSVFQSMTGYLHPEMKEGEAKEVWAGMPLKKFIVDNHELLSYCYAGKGERFVQRGNLFFATCVSIAMGIAFGAVQLTGGRNRSCFQTCTNTATTTSCSTTRNSQQELTGAEIQEPELFSADTFVSAIFYVVVSQLTTGGMNKFISASIERSAWLTKPVIFLAYALGVILVILAGMFMANSGDESDAEVGLKISLTIAIVFQNLVAGWVAYKGFIEPAVKWFPARMFLQKYEGQPAQVKGLTADVDSIGVIEMK